jgi:phage shock protein C
MNTTKNISMGGYAFIVEEDAYLRLKSYTVAVKDNLAGSPGADEIMADIEMRIAEILRENMGGREVVINEDVTVVINRMGEPDVYVQDDTQKTREREPESENAGAEKRLYRETENKIVAGVCGGLGAYANIDPIWFRLAFAVAFMFYSTGFWLYIILWIVMPKAITRIQKLQMRGKRPDLKNIESSIRSEFKGVGDNFTRMTNNNRIADTINEIFTRIFDVIGHILRFALKIFAGFLSIGSLVFLIFLVFMMVTGSTSINVTANEVNVENLSSLIPHLFDTPYEGTLFYVSVFVFLAVPAIALLANSIRYLANIKTKTSKWVGFTGIAIWMLATICLTYSGIKLGFNFSQNATGKTDEIIHVPKGHTLILRMGQDSLGQKGLIMSDVGLDIIEAPDSLFTLRIFKEASGRTEAEADKKQRGIAYNPVITDSMVILPRTYTLPQGETIRAQSVTLELRVPRNGKIYIEDGMQMLLNGVDNVQDMYDSEMPGKYWIMTDKGLSCQGCTIPKSKMEDSIISVTTEVEAIR